MLENILSKVSVALVVTGMAAFWAAVLWLWFPLWVPFVAWGIGLSLYEDGREVSYRAGMKAAEWEPCDDIKAEDFDIK